MTSPLISIISPCFNEEHSIYPFLENILPILKGLNKNYEIIFINDGSIDSTLNILLEAQKKYKHIRILNLARNFGKEAALTAGLEYAKGDAIIPIDVDLQHPPKTIIKFIKEWENGYDIVVGKRLTRTGESRLKKITAKYFYHFYNKVSNISIPKDVGDFRLMDKKVVNALNLLPENQRFMKGLFSWVGFKSISVEYHQNERCAGDSSFNQWKLWNFAIDGITSFSTLPLRVSLYIGIIISFFSFLLAFILILETFFYGIIIPGYVSTITMILFLGGIQLIGIGILGEYIGRIYIETKRRPIYILENEY